MISHGLCKAERAVCIVAKVLGNDVGHLARTNRGRVGRGPCE